MSFKKSSAHMAVEQRKRLTFDISVGIRHFSICPFTFLYDLSAFPLSVHTSNELLLLLLLIPQIKHHILPPASPFEQHAPFLIFQLEVHLTPRDELTCRGIGGRGGGRSGGSPRLGWLEVVHRMDGQAGTVEDIQEVLLGGMGGWVGEKGAGDHVLQVASL